jgi:hypothetical protein
MVGSSPYLQTLFRLNGPMGESPVEVKKKVLELKTNLSLMNKLLPV